MTTRSLRAITPVKSSSSSERISVSRDEGGWALLGLLLALGVMSIFLASAIVPNVQKEVQRDKELEMLYRGQQMAEGIARYYNRGRIGAINILTPPTPLPYLTDLNKLRDGVSIGVRELKFVRPSAMIDPIANSEWEPVHARDPRIMKYLQAWAADTLLQIPTQYLLMAAPPQKSAFKDSSPTTGQTTGTATGPQPPNPNPATPNPGTSLIAPPRKPPTDDDDDDDDDQVSDPLGHLFNNDQPGHSNAPIVGVASKRKGPSINAYYGLSNYEDWIFLYIPKILPGSLPTQPQGPSNLQNPNPPRRVSP